MVATASCPPPNQVGNNHSTVPVRTTPYHHDAAIDTTHAADMPCKIASGNTPTLPRARHSAAAETLDG